MDLFSINNKNSNILHHKYEQLLLPGFEEHRNIIQQWAEGFVDRDNKIVTEFQTTYHSALWEFYLFALFKKLDFKINQTYDRPDFIISKSSEIYVEAVVSNIKIHGTPETERNMDDITSMFIPPYEQEDFYELLDEAIVRQANSLYAKNKKYTEYTKCSWVSDDKPYVVALASYDQVNYGREYIYSMMALLYGKYYNPITEAYEDKSFITKPGTTSDIKIGIFNSTEYENISAVIYSNTITVGKLTALSISKGDFSLNEVYSLYRDNDEFPHYKLNIVSKQSPEALEDGVFVFHNPNARNKISFDDLGSDNIQQFSISSDKSIIQSNRFNLMTRCDFSKLLSCGFNMLIQEYVRHYNKIGMEQFYDIVHRDDRTSNLSEIDFANDCCVYIIGTNINKKKHKGSMVSCRIVRPCAMPDNMLEIQAQAIIEQLIDEKKMGEPIMIKIIRDSCAFNVISRIID